MRILAVGTLGQPAYTLSVCIVHVSFNWAVQQTHEVKVGRLVQRHRVAVENIKNNGIITVFCELVGNELAVLPNTDHVWDDQEGGVLVNCLSRGLGDIGIDCIGNLDNRASGFASASCEYKYWGFVWREGRCTYSCLTPIVQHCAGG